MGDEFDTWSWSDPVTSQDSTNYSPTMESVTGFIGDLFGTARQVKDSVFYWENGYYPTTDAGVQQQDILGQAPQSTDPKPATTPFYANPMVIGGIVVVAGLLYLSKGK